MIELNKDQQLENLNCFQNSKWLNSYICLIVGTLIGTYTLGQCEPGSNSRGALHNPQISKNGASPSDTV